MSRTAIAGDAVSWSLIKGELNAVVDANRVSIKKRRWLLQVVHCTRALDSGLAVFIREKRIAPLSASRAPTALGDYLELLERHSTPGPGKLPRGSAKRYKKTIVKHRNRYMHEAGSYPHDERQIRMLLGEMEVLLSLVALL
jgi:hypothetical protein